MMMTIIYSAVPVTAWRGSLEGSWYRSDDASRRIAV